MKEKINKIPFDTKRIRIHYGFAGNAILDMCKERYYVDYSEINKKIKMNERDMEYLDTIKYISECEKQYDVFILTPPCKYWCRANWNRANVQSSLSSKIYLLKSLEYMIQSDKTVIVENTRGINPKEIARYGLLEVKIGRHRIWTNDFELLQIMVSNRCYYNKLNDRVGINKRKRYDNNKELNNFFKVCVMDYYER